MRLREPEETDHQEQEDPEAAGAQDSKLASRPETIPLNGTQDLTAAVLGVGTSRINTTRGNPSRREGMLPSDQAAVAPDMAGYRIVRATFDPGSGNGRIIFGSPQGAAKTQDTPPLASQPNPDSQADQGVRGDQSVLVPPDAEAMANLDQIRQEPLPSLGHPLSGDGRAQDVGLSQPETVKDIPEPPASIFETERFKGVTEFSTERLLQGAAFYQSRFKAGAMVLARQFGAEKTVQTLLTQMPDLSPHYLDSTREGKTEEELEEREELRRLGIRDERRELVDRLLRNADGVFMELEEVDVFRHVGLKGVLDHAIEWLDRMEPQEREGEENHLAWEAGQRYLHALRGFRSQHDEDVYTYAHVGHKLSQVLEHLYKGQAGVEQALGNVSALVIPSERSGLGQVTDFLNPLRDEVASKILDMATQLLAPGTEAELGKSIEQAKEIRDLRDNFSLEASSEAARAFQLLKQRLQQEGLVAESDFSLDQVSQILDVATLLGQALAQDDGWKVPYALRSWSQEGIVVDLADGNFPPLKTG